MSNPLITVGLTAYNAIDSIERAFESALSQKWPNLEIVIIDDCSNDGTREILDRIVRNHNEIESDRTVNIKFFSNLVNQGVAVSRNRIIDEATGDFVVFFDDDDVSDPFRVCKQFKRIVDYEKNFANGAAVICHTAQKVIYPSGDVRIASTMGQLEKVIAPAGHAVTRRVLFGAFLRDGYGSCPTCSQMARLSTYRSLGGFDSTLRRSEDTDFCIRLAEAGGHFVGIAEPLVTQYMTKTPEKNLLEEYRNTMLLMKKHKLIMQAEGQYDFCLRWIDLKYAWMLKRRVRFIQDLLVLLVKNPVLTLSRLFMAVPSIRHNLLFSRFHSNPNLPPHSN
jgi:glycosyltransferase involved in cell wall biosynthesis